MQKNILDIPVDKVEMKEGRALAIKQSLERLSLDGRDLGISVEFWRSSSCSALLLIPV